MEFHRLFVDGRFQCVVRVGERWQNVFIGRSIHPGIDEIAVPDCASTGFSIPLATSPVAAVPIKPRPHVVPLRVSLLSSSQVKLNVIDDLCRSVSDDSHMRLLYAANRISMTGVLFSRPSCVLKALHFGSLNRIKNLEFSACTRAFCPYLPGPFQPSAG